MRSAWQSKNQTPSINCDIVCDMKKYTVVLDTNLFVAASRSKKGAAFAILQALRHQHFTCLVSVPMMLEYESVLKRPEHLAIGKRTPEMVDKFLDALTLLVEPVHLFYLWRPQLKDIADEMVLETALNGRADAIVTFNTRDFAPAKSLNVNIWTPEAFLLRLKETDHG